MTEEQQLQLDYYNTFLSGEAGRRVLFNLQQKGFTKFRDGTPMSPSEAFAQCMIDEFVMQILEQCGINTPETQMKVIEAQAAIAAAAIDEMGDEEENGTDLLTID